MKYKIRKILYFKIKKPPKTAKILRLVSKAQDIMRYSKNALRCATQSGF